MMLLCALQMQAQVDTIKIMGYNLLQYGNGGNPLSYKDPRLTTILQYVKPDIFGVNEIGNSPSYSQNILDNILGAGWSKGTFSNTNNEIQTNMLFWKTAKFGLVSQTVVCHNLRDIIAFRLYYKDTIKAAHDTVFLTVIVGHLKASSSAQDEADRAAETWTVASYLNTLNKSDNYIYMGDMNVYSSNEQAYVNLVSNPNHKAKLNDPINRPGGWHSDPAFADIHTQATRTASLPDGGSTGGLDDRFDHILVSNYIMGDSDRVKYIPGTYKTVGQDGQHYNKALNAAPANTAVPANVVQALYEMSDHLPVTAGFRINPGGQSLGVVAAKQNSLGEKVSVVNPVAGELELHFDPALIGRNITIQLYTVTGATLLNANITPSETTWRYDIAGKLNKGIYTVVITSGAAQTTKKIVKQ